jgi:hypothetical protein
LFNKRSVLLTVMMLIASYTLTACARASEQPLTGMPTPNSSLSSTTVQSTPTSTAAPASIPTASSLPISNVPSPTPKPDLTPVGQYSLYVNDVFGYQLTVPAEATVTESGVESFPSNEVPAGMTSDEYANQLRAKYPGKLCTGVRYRLSSILISAPPNQYSRYAPCATTGIGDYEVITRTEAITIAGRSYTAEGWEVKGPDETLAHHYEFLHVTLADGTEIEYGSWPDETATYADYLKTKSDLVQILTSYAKIR